MVWTVKNTTLGNKIAGLICVDESDSDTIKDLIASNTQPAIDAGVTVGTGEWGTHFSTLADGSFDFLGLRWTSGALIPLSWSTGFSYFVICNGASAPGGTTSGRMIFGSQANDGVSRGASAANEPQHYLSSGFRGNPATTPFPTDGTAFMHAGVYDRDNTQQFFYGVFGGSLASDSTPVDPSFWGGDDTIKSIGGLSGFGNSPMEVVAIGFTSAGNLLSLAEFQTIFADWKGALVDTGATEPAITDANTDEILAQGEAVTLTGTSFPDGTGSSAVTLSPTDNIADASAITQTGITWTSATSLSIASFDYTGTGIAEEATGYLFVTDATGSSNASGFAITRQDITPPNLSLPTATGITANAVTLGATTDEADGVAHAIITAAGDQSLPTNQEIIDGNAPEELFEAVDLPITATGAFTFAEISGLSPATSYGYAIVHEDSAGNEDAGSRVEGTFSTLALPTITLTDPFHNGSAMLASETGVTAYVLNATTRALVATVSGLTTSAGGVLDPITDAALAAATSYKVVVEFSSGAEAYVRTAATP